MNQPYPLILICWHPPWLCTSTSMIQLFNNWLDLIILFPPMHQPWIISSSHSHIMKSFMSLYLECIKSVQGQTFSHIIMCHMIIRWDVYLTQECGGWMPIPFNWQGGVAIPRVPKKVEVASSFHSMSMAWVPSPFKKGCHDVWTLYQIFHYFVNTMT